jgi:P-type Mg2+ transporter
MSLAQSRPPTAADAPAWAALDLQRTCELPPDQLFASLESSRDGLTEDQAEHRASVIGRNTLRRSSALWFQTLARQFNNPLLILLGATAVASLALGEQTDALIILAIVLLSVGLGFVNEYRSEQVIKDLHARVHHRAMLLRDGRVQSVDVTAIVPGDVVLLGIGDVVPADLRLFETSDLQCDEAMLTGESMPVEKHASPPIGDDGAVTKTCAFMGTVVRAGTGRGITVATGMRTRLGSIARQLVRRPPTTAFAAGLRSFSAMLVRLTAVFTTIIFVVNVILRHSFFEPLLFALAIAVAITPQLLPAIVTISMSTGARHMAQRSVIVKRLLSIEDFGNIEVLFTDKTGTITEGTIRVAGAVDTVGAESIEVFRLGLLCNSATIESGSPIGGNPLDVALWEDPRASRIGLGGDRVLGRVPFDFARRRMSVLLDDHGHRSIVVKGAPEAVLSQCVNVPDDVRRQLDERMDAGERVLVVARRDAPDLDAVTAADEHSLEVAGLLAFFDPPKAGARESLAQLRALGIALKILTGDNERVARKVCGDLGLDAGGTLTGDRVDALDDTALTALLAGTTIFARVTPEQKSRIIRLQRALGVDVGFLGDGINDAVALHDADVGISVDSAVDVAKDAADIVLLDKDLGILAEGVSEGRRVFGNTIKYVLMGTSSNFGNMISTGLASLFLPFLPMLPSQLLLNNLLYDASEMTIPTDNVDPEQLRKPAHWDMGLIKRFLLVFGPINSLFDFTIFWVMLSIFHADPTLFRSGFFVENLLTQTLVIFAIRTRRVPFLRSRPSAPLTLTTLFVAAIGAALPFTPFAHVFGFEPLPRVFGLLMLIVMTAYFGMVEIAKVFFYRSLADRVQPHPGPEQRLERIVARFPHHQKPDASSQGQPPA